MRAVRLDATDMGQPLYAKLGFRDECPVERWTTSKLGTVCASSQTGYSRLEDLGGFAGLDRQAFGADRSAVIARLLDCFPAERLQRAPDAFAMARPGAHAHFIGPCVAAKAAQARELIEVLLSRHAGEPLFWDLLPENADAVRLAVEFGFERRRRLVRMVLGDAEAEAATRSDPALQFATAGFEYG